MNHILKEIYLYVANPKPWRAGLIKIWGQVIIQTAAVMNLVHLMEQ